MSNQCEPTQLAPAGNPGLAARHTRILIADADPIVHVGINALLRSQGDLRVVGGVAHGSEMEDCDL